MIQIGFDITEVVKALSLSKNEAKDFLGACINAISAEVYREWREIASQELGSTRNQYKRGIIIESIDFNKSIIALHGSLPNMIESGASPFDMKDGFKNSLKIKAKKNGGWYLTIPFRSASSNSLGENEAFSNKLPEGVYDVAKNLSPSSSSSNKNQVYGGRLSSNSLP